MARSKQIRYRSRTIEMSEARSQQINLAAASLGGISSHELIQACITSGLLTLASRDKALGLAMARVAGLSWRQMELISKDPIVAELLGE